MSTLKFYVQLFYVFIGICVSQTNSLSQTQFSTDIHNGIVSTFRVDSKYYGVNSKHDWNLFINNNEHTKYTKGLAEKCFSSVFDDLEFKGKKYVILTLYINPEGELLDIIYSARVQEWSFSEKFLNADSTFRKSFKLAFDQKPNFDFIVMNQAVCIDCTK